MKSGLFLLPLYKKEFINELKEENAALLKSMNLGPDDWQLTRDANAEALRNIAKTLREMSTGSDDAAKTLENVAKTLGCMVDFESNMGGMPPYLFEQKKENNEYIVEECFHQALTDVKYTLKDVVGTIEEMQANGSGTPEQMAEAASVLEQAACLLDSVSDRKVSIDPVTLAIPGTDDWVVHIGPATALKTMDLVARDFHERLRDVLPDESPEFHLLAGMVAHAVLIAPISIVLGITNGLHAVGRKTARQIKPIVDRFAAVVNELAAIKDKVKA